MRILREAEDPLAPTNPKQLQAEFAVGTISPLLAAQEAVKGFRQLPESASKTFIFTGNALNSDKLVGYPAVDVPFSLCLNLIFLNALLLCFKELNLVPDLLLGLLVHKL